MADTHTTINRPLLFSDKYKLTRPEIKLPEGHELLENEYLVWNYPHYHYITNYGRVIVSYSGTSSQLRATGLRLTDEVIDYIVSTQMVHIADILKIIERYNDKWAHAANEVYEVEEIKEANVLSRQQHLNEISKQLVQEKLNERSSLLTERPLLFSNKYKLRRALFDLPNEEKYYDDEYYVHNQRYYWVTNYGRIIRYDNYTPFVHRQPGFRLTDEVINYISLTPQDNINWTDLIIHQYNKKWALSINNGDDKERAQKIQREEIEALKDEAQKLQREVLNQAIKNEKDRAEIEEMMELHQKKAIAVTEQARYNAKERSALEDIRRNIDAMCIDIGMQLRKSETNIETLLARVSNLTQLIGGDK